MNTGPIGARDDVQELYERWYSLCLAPRREHVVSQMVTVVLRLIVWPQEDLEAMPRGLYGVGVVPRVWIGEV
jgi:hypothetical protein